MTNLVRFTSLAAILLITCASSALAPAQDARTQTASKGSASDRWIGAWEGALDVGPTKLRLVFHIKRNDDGTLLSTLDSLDQGAMGIATSETVATADTITIRAAAIAGTYEGKWVGSDTADIDGKWTQGAATLPLALKRQTKPTELKRPQHPTPPFPYRTEEVVFENTDASIKLAGTLTLPTSGAPFAAAILVSGSGPQDRDESLMGHKPFLVLADHLTRKGIAVLRYDDRGVGGSKGSFASATTEDFTSDALAAVAFLKSHKEIDKTRIGIIGHSEGGLVAPWAASRSSDVAFIVLMAGPGVNGAEILELQGELIAKAGGATPAAIALEKKVKKRIFALASENLSDDELTRRSKAIVEEESRAVPGMSENEVAAGVEAMGREAKTLNSPWFKLFVRHDPRGPLAKVKCPVLAINGEKDLQVNTAQNLPEIEKTLKAAANKDVTVRELPGLNHLFQTSSTGAISEYGTIEETIAPVALNTISDWILARFSRAKK